MCGICGGLSRGNPLDGAALRRMLATLVHRGPDDEGTHLDAPVALGVRRLAVIDLAAGHQPMSNEDGSVWAVQNGEIYNHVELRERLAARGHAFRTKCDTEVLVHLYEERGADFVRELVGMFAVAIWDSRAGKLLLARDRLGKKPLYYAASGGDILFGSEIKALLASGRVSREPDPGALGGYLGKLYVGGGASIYREVRQLRPGHVLVADGQGLGLTRYWSPWDVPPRAGRPEEGELVEELIALLRESVRLRLRADVPAGCFLSGGIDSSLVARLAAEAAGRIRTFTIGFGRADYDESPAAREFAAILGSEHHEFRIDGGPDSLFERLPDIFDEPFGDSSAVPTWHVCRLTRGEVTVALSGDGGDEVFGGYRRYLARRWATRYNRLPGALRRAAEGIAGALGEPGAAYGGGLRRKMRAFTAYARQLERDEVSSRLDYFTEEMQRGLLVPELFEAVRAARAGVEGPAVGGGLDPVERAIRQDLTDYLPDDILVKVDRTSMDVSLEARAPLLDHRVVEFMLALPVEWKLRGRGGKYLLRRAAERLLPPEVLRRPKHGFAIELNAWFRPGGAGRRRLEELCGGSALRRLVRPEAVAGMLSAHESGRRELSEHLWAILMLGLWAERQG